MHRIIIFETYGENVITIRIDLNNLKTVILISIQEHDKEHLAAVEEDELRKG